MKSSVRRLGSLDLDVGEDLELLALGDTKILDEHSGNMMHLLLHCLCLSTTFGLRAGDAPLRGTRPEDWLSGMQQQVGVNNTGTCSFLKWEQSFLEDWYNFVRVFICLAFLALQHMLEIDRRGRFKS